MNNKFDELVKGMARSVTRRGALRNFGAGAAGMVLAWLGLVNTAEAGSRCANQCRQDRSKAYRKGSPDWENCFQLCVENCPLRI
jgi:hypothetical protein